MNIVWETRENYNGEGTVTWLAKIEPPSNLRRQTDRYWVTAAAVVLADGKYSVGFLPSIRTYFSPPVTRLNTRKGATRRVRKYIELWAIAGYPTRS
jgi:hypothetical protein